MLNTAWPEALAEPAAGVLVGVEVADHPAAAVEVDEQTEPDVVARPIEARRHRSSDEVARLVDRLARRAQPGQPAFVGPVRGCRPRGAVRRVPPVRRGRRGPAGAAWAQSCARRYGGGVRRWASSSLLVLLLLLAACGSRGLSRDQLYDRYVDDLTTSGVPHDVAQCVIDHLFDPMSDAQLKAFNTKGDAAQRRSRWTRCAGSPRSAPARAERSPWRHVGARLPVDLLTVWGRRWSSEPTTRSSACSSATSTTTTSSPWRCTGRWRASARGSSASSRGPTSPPAPIGTARSRRSWRAATCSAALHLAQLELGLVPVRDRLCSPGSTPTISPPSSASSAPTASHRRPLASLQGVPARRRGGSPLRHRPVPRDVACVRRLALVARSPRVRSRRRSTAP